MTDRVEWYAVRTKPRREAYAEVELRRRGIEIFLPRIVERARWREQPSVSPLFPGYLFAHLSLLTHHNRVVWAPGVRGFVTFGAVPTPVGDDVVAFLQERCGTEGLVRPEPEFRDGDQVRVRRGPLSGLVGIVRGDVSGRCRVRVLMELLRRRTEVSVPVELLERAGSP